MYLIPNFNVTGLTCIFTLLMLIAPFDELGCHLQWVEAKRPKTVSTATETMGVKAEKKSRFKQGKSHKITQVARLSAFELEPLPNPDYPTQLCGARRERLVALQAKPWVIKPFFLAQRRIEQWQYRTCLTKTMPEVYRYLESFPVPYVLSPAGTGNATVID
jgi:hypothetical protein